MDVLTWLRHQWDRVGGVALAVAGGAALLAGWLGVSDKAFPAEQIPYVISGGFVGLALIAGGATLWLSADLRDEWRKLDELDRSLARSGRTGTEPLAEDGDGTGGRRNGQRRRAPLRPDTTDA